MKKFLAFAALAAVLASIGLTASTATGTSTLTGSVSITCSVDGCHAFQAFDCENEILDLDSLYVNVDEAVADNGRSLDGIKLGQGCTGRIGTLTCITISQDCVKITGAHDLTIGGVGSSIACNTTTGNGHQDGIQVLAGSHIDLVGIDDHCTSATNAQLYINPVNGGTPPDHVYFIGGILHPDPTHVNNIVLNGSVSSGVIDSVVCPDAKPNPFQIGPNAVDPVNIDNTYPASC